VVIPVAASILALTVGVALARPRVGPVRLRAPAAAWLGALLSVASGLVAPNEAIERLASLAEPVVTLVSLMAVTVIADRAGFFRELGHKLAHAARGDGRRLFAYLFFAGTFTGAIFTNDAAVLIFTPLVLDLTAQIRDASWQPLSRRAYFFAVLYVANLVGLLLISNPINLVVADIFDIGFAEYATWMFLPALVSIGVTFAGLRIYFRKSLPRTFRPPPPLVESKVPPIFRRTCAVVLALTLAGFFGERLTGIRTAHVALVGALALAVAYRTMASGSLEEVARGIGWDAVVFVTGIFVVATAVRNAGAMDPIATLIMTTAETTGSEAAATFATAGIAATGSAVMNNHPVAQMMALMIDDLPLTGTERLMKVLAALIGGDLGPKMLPMGSLAALLWLRILRDRGIEISYRRYVLLGVPITFAAMLSATATLVLEQWLYHQFA
jgi:arsenical pump membrane protein